MIDTHQPAGTLLISLDFELYWGVLESKTLEGYREHLEGVPAAVESMLTLFQRHNIGVTWATVGLLYCKDRDSVFQCAPAQQPSYVNRSVDPYRYLATHDTLTERYHFAGDMIKAIMNTPHQELATHTFSHYFCQETGQTKQEFESDLRSALLVAQQYGHDLSSIVFPRNQVNDSYLDVLSTIGIKSFRGVEDHWAYNPDPRIAKSAKYRLYRLLDSYINFSGHHTHPIPPPINGVLNLKASRFLRPYSKRLRWLDSLKIRRIKQAMTHAAVTGEVFHLWWHPHNFGTHLADNMRLLAQIMDHYTFLKERYGMRSQTMAELAHTTISQSEHPAS